MRSVLDPIIIRRPLIDYVSPPVCEVIFSATGAPIIILNPIGKHKGPTGLVAHFVGNGWRLTWDDYPGALCFNIYRGEKNADCSCPENLTLTLVAECVQRTPDGYFTPIPGCYAISAITPDGESEISDPVPTCIDCSPPKVLDPVTHLCVCPAITCPLGQHQDPDTCECVGCAIPAEQPLQTRSDTIDNGTVSLFQGAGFFAKRYTFEGKAGQQVSFWSRSAVVNSKLYVAQSDNTVLTGFPVQANGYAIAGDVGFAAKTVTLPIDDTYTIEVTTVNPGEVGAIYTSWSTATTLTEFTANNLIRDMTYVEETDRLWVLNNDRIEIVNPATLTLETTIMPLGFANARSITTNGLHVYVGYLDGHVERFSNTGASLNSRNNGTGGLQVFGTSADDISIWSGSDIVGPGSTPTLFQTYLDLSADIGTLTLSQTNNGLRVAVASPHARAYVAAGGAGKVLAVDRTMLFSALNIPASGGIQYQEANDSIYLQTITGGGFHWSVIDPNTDTEIFRSPATDDFGGQAHCPCNDTIYMAVRGGIILINTGSRYVVEHFLSLSSDQAFPVSVPSLSSIFAVRFGSGGAGDHHVYRMPAV